MYIIKCCELFPGILYCNFFDFCMQLFATFFIFACYFSQLFRLHATFCNFFDFCMLLFATFSIFACKIGCFKSFTVKCVHKYNLQRINATFAENKCNFLTLLLQQKLALLIRYVRFIFLTWLDVPVFPILSCNKLHGITDAYLNHTANKKYTDCCHIY